MPFFFRTLATLLSALSLFAAPLAAQIQLFPSETYDYDVAPGIQVQFVQSNFNASGMQITTGKEGEKRITLIDGKRAYGNDRGQLYELLSTGTVILQGKRVPIETTFMFNPRLGAVLKLPLEVRQSKAAFYLIGTFGRDENTYYAVWRIRDDKSTRVLLTDDKEEIQQYL